MTLKNTSKDAKKDILIEINFDNSYAQLPEGFRVLQNPKPVAVPTLIKFNHALAKDLGIDVDNASNDTLAQIFGGNIQLKGSQPLAMAYSGHQFGGFSPVLGDGRANLMGEVVSENGARYDIQLKGSGPTAFSRNGDGRSALGPVLREYVVSEAMHKMSVPTTRALACVLSGEKVRRETALAGGVFTRVALGHIRVGTFQYFAARQDVKSLRTLMDYTINRFYPDLKNSDNPALNLLNRVIEKQAHLIAKWLSVGFIHGVMNTDNVSVAGETIDYGPAAFMDEYDPATVYSFIDKNGRYAYNNQAPIALWNLSRFAECLLPFIDDDQNQAVKYAHDALEKFNTLFEEKRLAAMAAKIGIEQPQASDQALVQMLLDLMQEHKADFTNTFRSLSDNLNGNEEPILQMLDDDGDLRQWLKSWKERLAMNAKSDDEIACQMNAINPLYIPRNHLVEEVIEAAYNGDYSKFEKLHTVLSNPFEEQKGVSEYAHPPTDSQRVANTFCGT